jgi:hypothetical protein
MTYLNKTEKKDVKRFLRGLKTNLQKDLDTVPDKEKRTNFFASAIGFDFSVNTISMDVKRVLKTDNRVKTLGKTFSSYLSADIKKYILPKYRVIPNFQDFLRNIKNTEGREKTLFFHLDGRTLWFFAAGGGPATKHQVNSFRNHVINVIVEKARTDDRKYGEEYYRYLSGIQAGHTFGFRGSAVAQGAFNKPEKGFSIASTLASNRSKIKGASSRIPFKIVKSIKRRLRQLLEIDINLTAEKNLQRKFRDGKALAKLDIKYIQGIALEESAANESSGSKLKGDISTFITKQIDKAITALEKDVTATDIATILSSKSIEGVLRGQIEDVFLGKKPRSYKSKVTRKEKVALKTKVEIETALITLPSNFDLPDSDVDLNDSINRLNDKLHDKIQQNMGKGNSKRILNYRTGRFAKSAEILAFAPSREKNAVNVLVKYMRDPYGTFEPEGRLHLPGRDPHRIFGRSIRQLLQEEKITNLRRVKVELRG